LPEPLSPTISTGASLAAALVEPLHDRALPEEAHEPVVLAQLLLEVLQLQLFSLQRGDVGERLDDADLFAGGATQDKSVHDELEGAAVGGAHRAAAVPDDVEGPGLPPLPAAGLVRKDAGGALEHGAVLAQDLALAVSRHRLGRAVEEADEPLVVDDHDAVPQGLQDLGQKPRVARQPADDVRDPGRCLVHAFSSY
jgi:hypothetical protein